ncbi:hypothetical protein MTO96_045627 [Rhipicephalus appendiculatus]
MKSEAWRRVRLYSDWLKVVTYEGQDKWIAARRLQEYHRLSEETTEFVWKRTCPNLPSVRLASAPESTVTILGNVNLPADVKDVHAGKRDQSSASSLRLTVRNYWPRCDVWEPMLLTSSGNVLWVIAWTAFCAT